MLEFDIVRALSQGGMADLFLARSRSLVGVTRPVVIKRLRLKYSHDPEFAAMFMDEARIALSLEHSNIVRTYGAGSWDGSLYIALEYLRGADLAHLLNRARDAGHAVALEVALSIVRSIAAALDHAHTRTDLNGRPMGIVHRDISPGNVFICIDGQVKLLDFGVAACSDRISRRTPTGLLKGKFPYMSPEQCMSGELDGRSDLFSLGVLLYELTTGRRPFRGLRAVDIVRSVIEAPIDPPSWVKRDYPPELETVVLRALSKQPSQRPATAEDFGRDLEDLARRLGLVLAPGPVAHFARAVLGGSGADADVRTNQPAELEPYQNEATLAVFPAPAPARDPHTVLVVDDDESVHRIIKSHLTAYRRISAYTAAQALDALATQHVDVVLLDLNLPDRNGYDVLDQIRHAGVEVAVIVCTAVCDVGSAVESMRRGAFDFVVKSHESYESLPQLVHRALVRRRLSRGSDPMTA